MHKLYTYILIGFIATVFATGTYSQVSAQAFVPLDGSGSDPVFPTGAGDTGSANPTFQTGVSAGENPVFQTAVPLQNTDPVFQTGVPADGTGQAATGDAQYLIKNPLSKTTTLSQVVLNVVSIVRILLIMAAVLYLLYAGFMFVTARGAPEKIKKARNALLWGCVGIALILASQVIVTSLQNTVSGIFQ